MVSKRKAPSSANASANNAADSDDDVIHSATCSVDDGPGRVTPRKLLKLSGKGPSTPTSRPGAKKLKATAGGTSSGPGGKSKKKATPVMEPTTPTKTLGSTKQLLTPQTLLTPTRKSGERGIVRRRNVVDSPLATKKKSLLVGGMIQHEPIILDGDSSPVLPIVPNSTNNLSGINPDGINFMKNWNGQQIEALSYPVQKDAAASAAQAPLPPNRPSGGPIYNEWLRAQDQRRGEMNLLNRSSVGTIKKNDSHDGIAMDDRPKDVEKGLGSLYRKDRYGSLIIIDDEEEKVMVKGEEPSPNCAENRVAPSLPQTPAPSTNTPNIATPAQSLVSVDSDASTAVEDRITRLSLAPEASALAQNESMEETANEPAMRILPGEIQAPVVRELEGDLFELAPPGAVLIHSCNALGKWGSGIAKVFKRKFPAAYSIYNTHCLPAKHENLLGTCLLIPPQEEDKMENKKGHWTACLFSSQRYGQHKAEQSEILRNTRAALESLKTQVYGLWDDGKDIGDLWACRFNSGKFAVPWEESRALLEETFGGSGETVTVVRQKTGAVLAQTFEELCERSNVNSANRWQDTAIAARETRAKSYD
ncbi:MAG: hypothetical protein Q9227_000592 [Pyrenula ochraceoflavens]